MRKFLIVAVCIVVACGFAWGNAYAGLAALSEIYLVKIHQEDVAGKITTVKEERVTLTAGKIVVVEDIKPHEYTGSVIISTMPKAQYPGWMSAHEDDPLATLTGCDNTGKCTGLTKTKEILNTGTTVTLSWKEDSTGHAVHVEFVRLIEMAKFEAGGYPVEIPNVECHDMMVPLKELPGEPWRFVNGPGSSILVSVEKMQ